MRCETAGARRYSMTSCPWARPTRRSRPMAPCAIPRCATRSPASWQRSWRRHSRPRPSSALRDRWSHRPRLRLLDGDVRGLTAQELRHVRTVVAIARHGSFTKAGEELHLAQSAVSQQLSRLESELGITLFTRSSRSVELTTEGALVLDYAQRVLSEVDGLRRATPSSARRWAPCARSSPRGWASP